MKSLSWRSLAFVAFLASAASLSAPAGAQTWKVTDLGVLPGGNSSFAYKINNAGVIVGESNDAANVCCRRTVVWIGGVPTGLPLPAGTSGGSLGNAGINDAGQVVGLSLSATGYRGVRWDGTAPTFLNGVGGSLGIVFAINNSGVAAGRSQGGSVVATVWNGTTPSALSNPLGAFSSEARDINNVGVVAGFAVISGVGSRATVWNGVTPTLLPQLAGSISSEARAINASGAVVGYGVSGGQGRAIQWSAGAATALATLPGAVDSEANGINAAGDIVGSSSTDFGATRRPILWKSGSPIDLFANSDAISKGWTSGIARGINDAGQIVGYGVIAGQTHAFLLRPSVELLDPLPMGGTAATLILGASAGSLLDGNSITRSIDRLSRHGRAVQGIAADGVSQVVLRIRAAAPGQSVSVQVAPSQCIGRTTDQCGEEYGRIFDPLSPPKNIYSNADGSGISIVAVNTNSGPLAFAAFRAPVDFVRSSDANFRSTDADTGERSIILTINGVSTSIKIRRPPVAFIHGLWTDGQSTWAESYGYITRWSDKFYARYIEYNDDVKNVVSSTPPYDADVYSSVKQSALGITYVANVVLPKVQSNIDTYRQLYNLASSQIDIVAHSMGGPVSRALTNLAAYKSPENFGQGRIHKLITIASPHLGTPFANEGLRNENICVRDILANKGMISAIAFVQSLPNFSVVLPGAVNDLQVGSHALKAISSSTTPKIPVAYLGGNTDAANLSGLSDGTARILRNVCGNTNPFSTTSPLALALTPELWNTVYSNQANDGIVPVFSMGAGYNKFAEPLLSGVIHSRGSADLGFNPPDILNSPNMIANVVNLLNTSVKDASKFILTPQ